MSVDINSLKSISQQTVREIAKQASALAVGLENAAPPQNGGPNKSVAYLSETGALAQELIHTMEDVLSAGSDNEKHVQLITWIRDAIRLDNERREKYVIGDKFKFIRDRFNALLADLESQQEVKTVASNQNLGGIAEDEVTVYVYLFNAQGLVLQSWRGMFTPKLFYEYSVNRPIYGEKAHIESLTKSKANPVQHAYLSVTIKQKDILQSGDSAPKDAMGNPVLKVREGALNIAKLVSFTHNAQEYEFDEEKGLIRKTPPASSFI
ncbi:MAG: type IVB secretion system protein IcmQ [Gammaproteobacteria bacterium]|nr:type IVB secretion system protein IcmQ [Gammaproteobacteria bacterium]